MLFHLSPRASARAHDIPYHRPERPYFLQANTAHIDNDANQERPIPHLPALYIPSHLSPSSASCSTWERTTSLPPLPVSVSPDGRRLRATLLVARILVSAPYRRGCAGSLVSVRGHALAHVHQRAAGAGTQSELGLVTPLLDNPLEPALPNILRRTRRCLFSS